MSDIYEAELLTEVVKGSGGVELLPATSTRLGGIKVGTNLTITDDGTLSASASGGGITAEVKTALLNCFANVAWINENGQSYYNALQTALNNAGTSTGGGSSSGGDSGDSGDSGNGGESGGEVTPPILNIPALGLLAHYNFANIINNQVNDLSGNNRNLTINDDNVTVFEDHVKVDYYTDVLRPDLDAGTANFSSGEISVVIKAKIPSINTIGGAFSFVAFNKINFLVYLGNPAFYDNKTAAFYSKTSKLDNEIHTIVGTIKAGGQERLYIDGELVFENTTKAVTFEDGALKIFSGYNSGGHSVNVYQMAVYNRELNDAEISVITDYFA